jgi:DNA-binding NarL/FixJ family response regulator
MTIRLLIADDHEVIRTGIISLVEGTEIEVVAQAASGEQAVRLACEVRPDVALIDIRMSEGDGFTALSMLKQELPSLRVVILSTYDNPAYLGRALERGAAGYLTKGSERELVLASIRKAAAGESSWRREELRRLSASHTAMRAPIESEVPLTKREAEVLKKLALGMTNKEIGRSLEIGYETVKEHVEHILHKIGVSDRTQAAVWAVRQGIA